jgi:hypothetical protein
LIESEFVNIIQKIADEQGKDIFLETKKLKAVLADYTRNEYRKEREFLLKISGLKIADTDIIGFINNYTENPAECRQILVKHLYDEYDLATDKSAEMLNVLFLALRGEKFQHTEKPVVNKPTVIVNKPAVKNQPVDINELKRIRENINKYKDCISASITNTVGLKTDGTVVAVGFNYQDQCCVGDWSDIVAVASGFAHTVGLKADGTVVAVGLNDDGQCNVRDWRDIVAVATGGDNTVGLKADGTVVAVGNHEYGQRDTDDWHDIGPNI